MECIFNEPLDSWDTFITKLTRPVVQKVGTKWTHNWKCVYILLFVFIFRQIELLMLTSVSPFPVIHLVELRVAICRKIIVCQALCNSSHLIDPRDSCSLSSLFQFVDNISWLLADVWQHLSQVNKCSCLFLLDFRLVSWSFTSICNGFRKACECVNCSVCFCWEGGSDVLFRLLHP